MASIQLNFPEFPPSGLEEGEELLLLDLEEEGLLELEKVLPHDELDCVPNAVLILSMNPVKTEKNRRKGNVSISIISSFCTRQSEGEDLKVDFASFEKCQT